MYEGKATERQQTPSARRARLKYLALEVVFAVAFGGAAVPMLVYLFTEALS